MRGESDLVKAPERRFVLDAIWRRRRDASQSRENCEVDGLVANCEVSQDGRGTVRIQITNGR
jgi:hypothetical protein